MMSQSTFWRGLAPISHTSAVTGCLAFAFALGDASQLAAEDAKLAPDQASGITLHLIPQRDGFLESTFGRDLARMRSTSVYKAAQRFGIDPMVDLTGFVTVRQRGRGWFYLFHNTIRCDPPCPYFVQRVKKRISNFVTLDGQPDVTDQFLVEAVKNQGGQSKRPDQHYASYSLQKYERRVIEKWLEVGEVVNPEGDDAAPWPYNPRHLFHSIQDYDPSRETYDAVEFKRSVQWLIRVEIDNTGKFSLQSPELGIDIQRRVPLLPSAAVSLQHHSERVELIPGKGLTLLPLGISEADARRVLGHPLRISSTRQRRMLHHGNGLLLIFGKTNRLSMIVAGKEFPGKTPHGIQFGDEKAAVEKVMGKPVRESKTAHSYDGLQVIYDAAGKVKSLSVMPKKPPE